VAIGVEGDLLFELGGEFGLLGAGPHDAHLAPEDVPELGYLIEAELAEDGADRGYEVGIVIGEAGFRVFAVFHGAELVHCEGFAAKSRAGLTEEHGESGVDDDGRNNDDGHEGTEDQARHCHEEVQDPLARVGEGHLEDHVVVVAECMGDYQGDPVQGVFRELGHVLQEASLGQEAVGPLFYLWFGVDVGVAHQDRTGSDRGLFQARRDRGVDVGFDVQFVSQVIRHFPDEGFPFLAVAYHEYLLAFVLVVDDGGSRCTVKAQSQDGHAEKDGHFQFGDLVAIKNNEDGYDHEAAGKGSHEDGDDGGEEVPAAHHVEAAEGVDTQGQATVEDEVLAEELEAAVGADKFDKGYGAPEDSCVNKHLQIFRHPDSIKGFSHMFCHSFLVDILKLERNKPRHSETVLC